jgi:hypothetical protein
MNTFETTLEKKMKIDEELANMKRYPIDFSDIPPMTEEERRTGRLHYKAFLDTLPREVVREMARRRLEQREAADDEVPEPDAVLA